MYGDQLVEFVSGYRGLKDYPGSEVLTIKYRRSANTVEPLGTDTSILRAVSNVPTKFPYIFFKKNLYNTDFLSYGQWTLNLAPESKFI